MNMMINQETRGRDRGRPPEAVAVRVMGGEGCWRSRAHACRHSRRPAPHWRSRQSCAQRATERLQGFSQNRDKPVQIDAASLEVRDKDKVATFLGNVRMTQGDTTMRCKTMKVFYDQDAGAAPATHTLTAAKPGPGRGAPADQAVGGQW